MVVDEREIIGYVVALIVSTQYLNNSNFSFYYEHGFIFPSLLVVVSAYVLILAVVKVHESLFKFGWLESG